MQLFFGNLVLKTIIFTDKKRKNPPLLGVFFVNIVVNILIATKRSRLGIISGRAHASDWLLSISR